MRLSDRVKWWLAWGLSSLALASVLAFGMFGPTPANESGIGAEARHWLLPGTTSHGHYQIELVCESCHREAFGGDEVLQDACMDCHGEELKAVDDSHPKSKFTDPRNAERVAKLDARLCITCHVEHRPGITGDMGLTQPADVCAYCHYDIAEERPSHEGMGFETCASAGCHNFHDNQALYEDFLLKHLDEPALAATPRVPERELRRVLEQSSDYPADRYPLRALTAAEHDAPPQAAVDGAVIVDWADTAHAKAGVNCTACHRSGEGDAWTDIPDRRACAICHGDESQGFLLGRHGMRLNQGLSPMTPAGARLPMKPDAGNRELGCNTCHGAHRFDVRKAAVEACLGCHDDEHSRAYEGAPHHREWLKETAAGAPAGSGVSCATCHLPRIVYRRDGALEAVLVLHNQNDVLRPNEKMLRPVCMHCHGLGFSIDALADPGLIETNFRDSPAHHIESIDMAAAREKKDEAKP